MEREENFFSIRVGDVMNTTAKTARPDELASAVVHRMETHGIMSMPVVAPTGALLGIVHLHDIMRAGAA
jgi:arabinose-5-phosphate isomerase